MVYSYYIIKENLGGCKNEKKFKLISLGILSTVIISTTPVFAATITNTSSNNKTVVITIIMQPSFNYGPNGGPTATTIINNGGVIQLGDIGLAVKNVQACLVAEGYLVNSDIDGIFGAKTKIAVCSFQAHNGTVTDGIVGSQTWMLLK